jgi:hypothetical protein
MASFERKADRPPLKPSDVYRPRLGQQPSPLSRRTMSELRAWREAATAEAVPATQQKSKP